MLKHATINRTSRAQQTLQLQRQWQRRNQLPTPLPDDAHDYSQQNDHHQRQQRQFVNVNSSLSPFNQANQLGLDELDGGLHAIGDSTPCSPLPSPLGSSPSPSQSLLSTPSKSYQPSGALGSQLLFDSPRRPQPSGKTGLATSSSATSATATTTRPKCNSESMIKVFAQTLSQDVEYVTLHVNTQTKSNHVVKSLLKKFRLKHRDPNLFYLTLERWIRKDGLKFKSVMLLGDEACPLQLQQCCSNPPHNDIKFTLQTRAGALVKIFCHDVVPDAQYKCLSLSTQTTVDETIELMLHCLNLVAPGCLTTNVNNNNTSLNNHSHNNFHLPRLSGSPGSTSSSASSNSSSSGIESEPNCNHLVTTPSNASIITTNSTIQRLNLESRTSSVTSISSASNISNISTSITDQYSLVIECKDTNYKRSLDPDEYLVEVYQNLVAEAKRHTTTLAATQSSSSLTDVANSNEPIKPGEWFLIKLKRRDNCNHHYPINFTSPRQNTPLPPIPFSQLPQFNNITSLNNADNLQHIVSTTQIEVNCRPGSSLATSSAAEMCKHPTTLGSDQESRMPPPPQFILLPPVRPRRRNLSNASSTFVRPMAGAQLSRRRYDPAQLADDLNKLDVKEAAPASLVPSTSSMPPAPPLLSPHDRKKLMDCDTNHNQIVEPGLQQQQQQQVQPSQTSPMF